MKLSEARSRRVFRHAMGMLDLRPRTSPAWPCGRRSGGAVLVAALAAGASGWGCSDAASGASAAAPWRDRMAMPATVLWAWERPEDLRSMAGERGAAGAGRPARSQLGVAPLVATVTLREGDVEVRPRHQPLRLPPGTSLCPVVRIEVDRAAPPRLDDEQRSRVADAIVAVAGRAARDDSGRVQIDFEATASLRPFYRALLADLRARLGPRFPISITALASWCLGDRWLAGLPVDEVVPMYYRLGPRAAEAHELLSRHGDFPAPECRAAIGLSLDEAAQLPPGWPPTPRRTFLFNPRPWSAERIAAAAATATSAAVTPERSP